MPDLNSRRRNNSLSQNAEIVTDFSVFLFILQHKAYTFISLSQCNIQRHHQAEPHREEHNTDVGVLAC